MTTQTTAPSVALDSTPPKDLDDPAVQSGADFNGRLEEARRIANPAKRARAIGRLVGQMTTQQCREEGLWINKFKYPECKDVLQQIFARWAELEPEAALTAARALKGGGEGMGTATQSVLETWAARDPAGAVKLLAVLPAGLSKQTALNGLCAGLAENDPGAAFALLRQNGAMDNRDAAEKIFAQWADQNPAEARAHVLELPVNDARGWIIGEIATRWASTNVEGALLWAQSPEIVHAIEATGARSLTAALEPAVEDWMKNSPTAAMGFLKGQPDNAVKDSMVATLIRSRGDNNRLETAELAAMLPPGESRDTAYYNLGLHWAASDFPAALAWAQGQTDEQTRETALKAVIEVRGDGNPVEALEMAKGLKGEKQSGAISKVLSKWAGQDPAAAAAWASAEPGHAADLQKVAAIWAKKDAAGASQWINGMPDGVGKDELLGGVVHQLSNDKPGLAAEWITGIGDNNLRNANYQDVLGRWLKKQPTSAKAWIGQSTLPADMKQQLLGEVSP